MKRLGGWVKRTVVATGAVACLASAAAAAAVGSAPLQVSMMRGGQACVALTFDDGPDATLTPKLLDILESKNAVATFFVLGSRVQMWPDPVMRAAADGDEIGNHSWDHPVLPSLGSAMALGELTRTDDEIDKVIGQDPDVTRAPFGSLSERIASLSPRTYVAWSIDTLDWKYPDVDRITKAALKAVNGSIILMHDIHPKTIDAVPGIIDGLRQRGFQLVTVKQLLTGTCGGTVAGYGLSVPGAAPLDPFGVDAFQGQLADKASAANPATPAPAIATTVPTPSAASVTVAAAKAPATAAASPAASSPVVASSGPTRPQPAVSAPVQTLPNPVAAAKSAAAVAPSATKPWYVAQNARSQGCVVTPTKPNGASYMMVGMVTYPTVASATAAMRMAAECGPKAKLSTT